jgi:hypothetical protein
MDVYDDEVFSPLLGVIRVASLDEALALINSNAYRNGAAIFTASGAAAHCSRLASTSISPSPSATTPSAAGATHCSETPTPTAPMLPSYPRGKFITSR